MAVTLWQGYGLCRLLVFRHLYQKTLKLVSLTTFFDGALKVKGRAYGKSVGFGMFNLFMFAYIQLET